MTAFYVTDDNGVVIMTGDVPDNQLESQKHENIKFGKASLGDFLDAEGKLNKLPLKPNEYSVFDYVEKVYKADVNLIRVKRNRLLAESDWTDTYSAKQRLGESLFESWQEYRQALRDITEQSDLFNIEWPVAPDESL